MTRERTYSWSDPIALAQLGTRIDGIDFVRKLTSGEIAPPPAGVTIGMTPTDFGDGWARIELEPQEWHYNPRGTVHGGILSTLADTAVGIAVQTTLPRGTSFTSLDLIMKFTRSATVDSGLLSCEGRVVTRGRRVATAEATVTDAAGRVVAHAVSTCLIVSVPAEQGGSGDADAAAGADLGSGHEPVRAPRPALAAGRLRAWSRSFRIGWTPNTS